jgi:hypothetical protein
MKMNFFLNPKFVIFLIILYPLLFIWQGLDFTDMGYSLTNYQQIFNDPESSGYFSFNLWLTNIIGGIWILLFGDSLGLLGANLAGVLVTYLTIGLSYLLLKPYIDRKYLLIGLLFTLIFTKWFFLLHYDNLTALFFVASALFLTNGLKSANNWKVLVSGLILGLNIFIRLPNILGFSLILSIFFYGYINKTSIMPQAKQAISFISGYIIAILLALFTMKILGHYEIFTDSVNMLLNVSSDPQGHHNLGYLILNCIREYKRMIVYLSVGILGVLVVFNLLSLYKSRNLYYIFIVMLGIVALFVLLLRLLYHNLHLFHYSDVVFLVLGILYTVLLLYATGIEKSNKQLRLINFVALLILIIIPFGAGVGLRLSIFGMWIPIPIAYAYISRFKEIKVKISIVNDSDSTNLMLGLSSWETKIFRGVVFILLVMFSLYLAFGDTYNDSGNRIKMLYSVEHPRLRGIFTTQERAKVTQELLDEIPKYVNEDDYLLAYNEIPMLYFLTKTKPYLYNSWIEGEVPYKVKQLLDKAIRERPNLPVVVKAKYTANDPYWPKRNAPTKLSDINENIATIDNFTKLNGYSIVWENDFFEILIPQVK